MSATVSRAPVSSPPVRRRATIPDSTTLWALLAAAAVIRFAFIGTQGFWFDEAHTAALIHGSLNDLFAQLPGGEATPPLYFVAAWLWAHLFGYGEAGLRSLSALAGVLTVAVVYRIGARLHSARAGLFAAAFVTFNPFLVWYSQEARSYSLLFLLTSLSLLSFFELRRELTGRWVLRWAVISGLALWTHYFAALLIAPQLVLLVMAHSRHRALRAGVIGVAAAEVAVLPLAIHQMSGFGGKANWIHTLPLLARIGDVPVTFATGYAAPGRPVLFVVTAAIAVFAFVRLGRRPTQTERPVALDLLRILGMGAVIVIVLLVLGYDELDVRNVSVLLLPVILLIAFGLAGISDRRVRGGAVAIVCVAGLVAVAGVDLDPAYQRPDWRPVARALGGTNLPRSTAVFVINGCQGLPLALYMPELTFPNGEVAVRELDLIRVGRPIAWDSACSTTGLGRPLPTRLDGFQATGRIEREGRFSIERMRSPAPRTLRWRLSRQARFRLDGLPGILLVESSS